MITQVSDISEIHCFNRPIDLSNRLMAGLSSHYLDAFSTVAQIGHFTRAAQKLNITQSALSQRILNLESELGTTLLIRERSGIRLTESGEKLLRFCRQKTLLEDQCLGELKESPETLSGEIRIGAFSSVVRSVILPALAPLLNSHPALKLTVSTGEMRDIPALLKKGEIDFLISLDDLASPSIHTEKLGFERYVLVEKEKYHGPEIYLDHDAEDPSTIRYFKRFSPKRLRQELHRRYLDDVYGIIDGVCLGLGRAVLPHHLLKNNPELRVLNPERSVDLPVYLHYYDQPFYTKLQKATISALRSNCARYLV